MLNGIEGVFDILRRCSAMILVGPWKSRSCQPGNGLQGILDFQIEWMTWSVYMFDCPERWMICMGMTLCADSMTGKIVRSTGIYFRRTSGWLWLIMHWIAYGTQVHNLFCTYFVHHKVCYLGVKCGCESRPFPPRGLAAAARQLKCATSPPSAASRTGVETPEILQTSMAVGHRCLARVEWI
jgi:hypothetical protein